MWPPDPAHRQPEPRGRWPRFEAALGRIASAGRPLASRLPALPGSALLAAAFNFAFGVGGFASLEPLRGKIIALRVTDAGLCFRLWATRDGFVGCRLPGPPAVTISARGGDFVRLALRRVDPDTLFFSRRMAIEGDTELGLLLKNRLDALDLPALLRSAPRPRAVLAALRTALFVRPVQHPDPSGGRSTEA